MTESDPKPEQESESGVQPSAEGLVSEVARGESAEAAAETQQSAEAAAEAQESVQEFMAEAAEQNEAANEAVTTAGEGTAIVAGTAADDSGPAPFIAFEHVYKSFGDLVVRSEEHTS